GESGTQTSDACNRPSSGNRLCAGEPLCKRQRHLVRRDEVMFQVERGQAPRLPEVERIDWIRNAGCVIDRFAEGVAERKIDWPAGMPQTDLKRMIVGISDA